MCLNESLCTRTREFEVDMNQAVSFVTNGKIPLQ